MSIASLQSELNQIRSDIAALRGSLPAADSAIAKRKIEIRITQLTTQAAGIEEQIAIDQATLQKEAGVLPTPDKTAGQTVNDDSVPNPIKQDPLETDANTGRLQPPTGTGSSSNADTVSTTATGDTDTNTNGLTKTFSTTQSTSTSQDDGQGGPPVANPPPPTTVTTEVPPAGDQGGGGGAGAQVPPSGAPRTTSGAAAEDNNTAVSAGSTAVEVNNASNADQTIQPQDNILDNFASYTYGVAVYLMTPEAYKNFVTTKKRTLNGSNLLFQSGGAPGSDAVQFPGELTSTENNTAGRNPYFDVDFYIDSLTIDTAFPGKQTQAAHMASEIKFTVVEPNGITLLDRIYAAVQEHVPKDGAGKVNYTAVQYMLAIRWYGWDLNGDLIRGVGAINGLSDPNAAVEKFIPFKIKKINWGVNNKLVTYDFVCAPVGQNIAGGQSRGTIPYDIELTDSTVGGLLGGDTQYGTASTNTASAANLAAPSKANAAPSSKTTIRQGLMGAMNDFQQKLVRDGTYTYADHYEIVFVNGAEAIRDASITKPTNTIKNLGKSPMGKPATQDPNNLDPRKSQVDSSLRNSAVTAGQQLLQVIDLTIRNSTFITQQAREVNQEVQTDELGIPLDNPTGAPATAKITWHNITMEAVPREDEYDYKRNDYAYDIRYIISLYTVTNFDSKYFPIPKFNGLHKSYKYWFTGQNSAVLDYQATFNSLYNMTVSGSEPGNNATEAIRRKYTSSMREIPTYSYQSASSESRTGADGKGNEISSNAAQYLYSPSDLATTKLRIVGDPGWIQQGSLSGGVNTATFDYRGFLPDGTINFDSQQVMFEIAWQRPEDYNINTGLADPYDVPGGGAREPLQSFVYQARKCTSEFRQGKFEQTIEGSLYNFPVTEQKNTAATAAASVSVETNGASVRGDNNVSASALTLPGNGALAVPGGIDSVQLTAGSIAQAATNVPAVLSTAVNQAVSGDGVVPVLGLSAPLPLNQSAQITDQATQLISVNT